MRSKELSLQVKETILKLQKQKKPIREIATILRVAKSTVWYILRKKASTGELSNAKRPGHLRKTTVVDDRRIISMVKRNPFTTTNQVKNTLQGVGVSISKSTIKGTLLERKYRGCTARCKPLISLKNRKARLDFAKEHLKKPAQFRKNILWTDETKINLYQNDGMKKVWRRGGTAHYPKHTTSSVKHGGGSVMAWVCMAASGTGTLVFIDNATQDRSSRMNSEVFRDILSAQIQLNAVKLIGRHFMIQMDNDPKQSQEFIKAQKWKILQWPSQSPGASCITPCAPDLNPIENAFHLLKTKLRTERPTNKQQLKAVAVKAWQSIKKEETQHLVMSMSSRLQAVIASKGFSTKC
ncbi:TCB1 transposase, partial [Polypterus senegalus]